MGWLFGRSLLLWVKMRERWLSHNFGGREGQMRVEGTIEKHGVWLPRLGR
jgi:hypothetical protein